MRYKIVLVEDHRLMCDTCIFLINRSPDLEVCAAFEKAEDALPQVPLLQPDLVLCDVMLPGMSGIGLTEQLRTTAPELPVLLITGFENEHLRQHALDAGANGFLFKHQLFSTLLPTVRNLLAPRAA